MFVSSVHKAGMNEFRIADSTVEREICEPVCVCVCVSV